MVDIPTLIRRHQQLASQRRQTSFQYVAIAFADPADVFCFSGAFLQPVSNAVLSRDRLPISKAEFFEIFFLRFLSFTHYLRSRPELLSEHKKNVPFIVASCGLAGAPSSGSWRASPVNPYCSASGRGPSLRNSAHGPSKWPDMARSISTTTASAFAMIFSACESSTSLR